MIRVLEQRLPLAFWTLWAPLSAVQGNPSDSGPRYTWGKLRHGTGTATPAGLRLHRTLRGPSLTPRSCCSQVHVYDPYDDDYYQTVPLDSHQTAYISSGHYGHQYGGGWPHPAASGAVAAS